MRTLCIEQESLSNNFLNGVLNQLNWAFSEFVGILQEVCLKIHGFFLKTTASVISQAEGLKKTQNSKYRTYKMYKAFLFAR